MAKKTTKIYQLKVSLKGIRPPVWRRFQVTGNTTLLQLHDTLQSVMGWYDCHLHVFTVGGKSYGDPADDEYNEFGTLDECNYSLEKVISGEGQRFLYEYDFGDSWEHEILVEKILATEKGADYPVCIKGKRACPPEDVGGSWGYENFLEAIWDVNHEEHEEYLEWIGDEFDPEEFDLEAINDELRNLKQRRTRDDDHWETEDQELDEEGAYDIVKWQESLSPEENDFAEKLPLRRDMLALLTYLRETKVTGTSATGNFPLKAVAEICARFVEPVALERKEGDKVRKVRSEMEVWPFFFRHILASAPGFIDGGPGRRWKIMSEGERFIALPPAIQIWIMAANWWTQINWAIAVPYNLNSGYLGLDFRMVALHQMLELPLAIASDFKPFADRVIKEAGLVWTVKDQEFARYIMHATIEKILIKPHIDFGVLQATTIPDEFLGEEYRQISSITITPFGKTLLESLKSIAFSE
ncbi:MAG: plasmid pRiA4b ORF-3 family protein [Anaerolineaceae bacterium]|jgi:hypothetical protein|nr:plasmid pRiA4b ORF-3 family protein [Anaerolineaceae bacterium]